MGYSNQKNKKQWIAKFKHQLSEVVQDVRELDNIIEMIEKYDGMRRYGKSYIIKRKSDRNKPVGFAVFTEGKLYTHSKNGNLNKKEEKAEMEYLLKGSPTISLHSAFLKLKKSMKN